MDTEPATRPCDSTRCKRRVFDAQILPAGKGAPKDLVLDAEPKTWEQGARHLITPLGYQVTTVTKLTAATIHKAFGTGVRLYVEHREVCQVAARRTKAKKTDGSHA